MRARVLKYRRSLVVMLMQLLVGVLCVAVLVQLYVELKLSAAPGASLSADGAIFIYRVLCVGVIAEVARRYFNDLYMFGQSRVVRVHGVLSLRQHRTSICFADIREIRVHQSLLGRICGYGDLELGTSASDQEEIVLDDVPHAPTLAIMIDRAARADRMRRYEQQGQRIRELAQPAEIPEKEDRVVGELLHIGFDEEKEKKDNLAL